MKKLFISLTMIVIPIFFLIKCERTIPTPDIGGELGRTEISDSRGIPLAYGKLISITSPTRGIAHFWFEDEEKTIRQVQIIYGLGKKGLYTKRVRVIKRY